MRHNLPSLATPLLLAGLVLAPPLSARPLAPEPDAGPRVKTPAPAACDDGVVLDDGTYESGYGWVPGVLDGEYVQRFESALFPTRRLDAVCLCWLRTSPDATLDFELVLYRDAGGRPAAAPYAVVPASVVVAEEGIVGEYFEVDAAAARIPAAGAFYAGARWDPTADPFFFLCADQSDATPPVEVFFRDRLAEGEWTGVFETTDPIFALHRAVGVRARPSFLTAVAVPAAAPLGLGVLAALTAAAAWRRLAG